HAHDFARPDGEVDAAQHLVVAESLHEPPELDRRGVHLDQIGAHRCLASRRSIHATTRVSGMVMIRYSIAAITRGVEFAVIVLASRAKVVSSFVKIVEPAMNSSEVSLSSSTNSFVSGGMMMRNPCGRMIQN